MECELCWLLSMFIFKSKEAISTALCRYLGNNEVKAQSNKCHSHQIYTLINSLNPVDFEGANCLGLHDESTIPPLKLLNLYWSPLTAYHLHSIFGSITITFSNCKVFRCSILHFHEHSLPNKSSIINQLMSPFSFLNRFKTHPSF